MNQCILVFAVFHLSLSAGLGSAAQVSRESAIATPPTNKPVAIYIADFDLDAAAIKAEAGLLPPPPKLPLPVGPGGPALRGSPEDPQKLARKLVEEMSAALLEDLTKAGLVARRLAGTNHIPASGWLVRGVFTSVNQGNQLQRAVIGFGQGRTDLQVVVDLADLSSGAPRDFYELTTKAQSGKLPGAGALIALHPAAIAVRFVIAGKDLDRNVKQTAARIAKEVVERTKPGGAILPVEGASR